MRRIHGQDEDEGLDLFLTLKEKGYEFGVDTSVEVRHNHLTTSKKMKGFKESRDLVNWWRIGNKHDVLAKDFPFVVERMRNLSGYFKYLFK